MDKEELLEKIEQSGGRYSRESRRLYLDFNFNSCKYLQGDIFTDNKGSIKITEITYLSDKIGVIFYGYILNKKLERVNREYKRYAYLSDEII